ncbi:tRNA synthetases class II-domain-containing protein [Zopfochytrium polystomum]|nr:tRNA synthetases class II-domain-containing protein [Zopfochytrium polystomum]
MAPPLPLFLPLGVRLDVGLPAGLCTSRRPSPPSFFSSSAHAVPTPDGPAQGHHHHDNPRPSPSPSPSPPPPPLPPPPVDLSSYANPYRTVSCAGVTRAMIGTTVRVAGWTASPPRKINNALRLPTHPRRNRPGPARRTDATAAQGRRRRRPTAPAAAARLLRQTSRPSRRSASSASAPDFAKRRAAASDAGAASADDGDAGALEIVLTGLDVLNPADPLPFYVHPAAAAASGGKPAQQPTDELRLKHRHLDLRRPRLQHNLRARARAAHAVRRLLVERLAFTEVETPYLFKSTPEGAREFLVPTRSRGLFYALAQSPQQFKQVLVCAGVERYFQFARQPEFTQIDLEMAFAGREDVMRVVEDVVRAAWKEVRGVEVGEVPVMTYGEAMARFGSDKPDTRFGVETVVEAVVVPGGAAALAKRDRDAVLKTLLAESFPHYGGALSPRDFAFISRGASAATALRRSRILAPDGGNQDDEAAEAAATRLLDHLAAVGDDLVLLNRRTTGFRGGHTPLGRARTLLAAAMRDRGAWAPADPNRFDFLWVVDFPLFTPAVADPDDDAPPPTQPPSPDSTLAAAATAPTAGPPLAATHHPFTAPHPSDLPLLLSPSATPYTALTARGLHYDLVLNGTELAGGSVRAHNPSLQRALLHAHLRLPHPRIDADFGHLLAALAAGAPPHAGAAIGFERMVAWLVGERSIRDVVAFPKVRGGDLFVGCPGEVEVARLREYGLA